MELSRERFIEQFAITIQVTCLRLWRRRAKTVPIFLGRSFYEAMTTSGGGKQLLSYAADTRYPFVIRSCAREKSSGHGIGARFVFRWPDGRLTNAARSRRRCRPLSRRSR